MESLQPAGFLASPKLTGKGLPLKKAAAHVDTREVECPTAASPVGRRQGPGAKFWPRIKAAHSVEKNGGGGQEELLCSEEGWLLFLRTQGQLQEV